MGTKVYAVNTGCYSDYRIVGIYSTKSKAEEYMEKCRNSDACWSKDFNDIEVFILDQGLQEREFTRYSVGVFVDTGEVKEDYAQNYWGLPQNKVTQTAKIPCYRNRLMIRAESFKSKAHAIKLAVEARQAYLRKQTEPEELDQ